MKRTFIVFACVAALGVAGFVGSKLTAQNQPAQPRTRVALVNLPHVIKNYTKYKAFETEWQEQYKGYEKQLEGKRALLAQMQADGQKATDQPTRDKIEANMRTLQFEMQNMGEEAKKVLGKKRDDQSVMIYKEIEEAVAAFAKANDIEMVLHYSDNVDTNEIYTPMNVQRKLSMGACFPVYKMPNMDITQWITQMLNQRHQAAAGVPAQGGVQPAGFQR